MKQSVHIVRCECRPAVLLSCLLYERRLSVQKV